MKPVVLAIALTGLLSVTAVAGNIPTNDVVAPSKSRNSFWLIQRRRRTTSSSIIAMCAAGPPKAVVPNRRKSKQSVPNEVEPRSACLMWLTCDSAIANYVH